ncbi:unnamed protein product, partial [marine sediment metagenome]
GVSKLRAVYYNVKNYRAAILILIFLVCMPLVFISTSIIRINQPDLQFAQIPEPSSSSAQNTSGSGGGGGAVSPV